MKKFIIELDEDKYIKLRKYVEQSDCSDYFDNAIAKAIPLEEELENIKTEINEEDIDCQYEDDYVYSGGLQKAIEIIDNRISELKGENK